MAIFNSYVSHYQRVSVGETWVEVGRVHILLAMIGTPLGTPWCVGGRATHLRPAAAPLVFVGQGIKAAREEGPHSSPGSQQCHRSPGNSSSPPKKKTGR